MRRQITVEINRGREERRQYFVMPAPQTLPGFAGWANLTTIVMVVRTTVINGREAGEVSYFLSSLPAKIKNLAKQLSDAHEPTPCTAVCVIFKKI